MTGDELHVNAHDDLRDRVRSATRDAAGYVETARVLRRREAAAEVHGAADAGVAASARADLWLRVAIALTLAGCVLAGLGALAGLLG